jgi:hypothetical protein
MITPKPFHLPTPSHTQKHSIIQSLPKPHTRSAARESSFLSLFIIHSRFTKCIVWAHLRRKRNHIIVQSDRRRGGLKMSSILYLHQAAYIKHILTTQCQILLMFRCSSLCERPTTSPTKKPHSKCTPLKNTAPQNIWAPRRNPARARTRSSSIIDCLNPE